MIRLTSTLRAVAFSLCSILILSSVSNAASNNVKRLLQVVSFKPIGGDNSLYWQTDKKKDPAKEDKVRVSSSTLLTAVEYEGPKSFTLMSKDSGSEYRAVANVQIPAQGKRVIVILFPASKDSQLDYKAVAINGDENVFKAGTRNLFNLSKLPVRGELGAKPFRRGDSKNVRFTCNPQKVVEVPVLDENAKVLASQPVVMEYYGSNKKWNVLSSTRWFHTPTQRHLVFIYVDGERNNMILRGVSDTVAADTRNIAANRSSKPEDAKKAAERSKRNKRGQTENPRLQ
jgi:hypothetical protein